MVTLLTALLLAGNDVAELHPLFKVHGALAIARPNKVDRMPDQVNWILVLRQPGRRIDIHSLADLQGHVEITSADAALDYARLLTTPLTQGLLRSDRFELIPERIAKTLPLYTFGAQCGYPNYAGWLGILSNRDFASHGFTPASVTKTNTGWDIRRWLTYHEPQHRDRWHAMLVLEHVSPDGAFRRETIKSAPPTDQSGLTIRLPMFK